YLHCADPPLPLFHGRFLRLNRSFHFDPSPYPFVVCWGTVIVDTSGKRRRILFDCLILVVVSLVFFTLLVSSQSGTQAAYNDNAWYLNRAVSLWKNTADSNLI